LPTIKAAAIDLERHKPLMADQCVLLGYDFQRVLLRPHKVVEGGDVGIVVDEVCSAAGPRKINGSTAG
jgi:hypothetical protein